VREARTTRRGLLAAVGTGATALAGCTTLDDHRVWRYGLDETPVGPPVPVGDRVLLATRGDAGHLHALDRATGERRFRVTLPRPRGPPAVGDGLAALPTEEGVASFALEAGTARFRALDGESVGDVVAVGERLYASTGGRLAALGPDGAELWAADADTLGPLAAGTLSVVTRVTGDGEALAAFDPEDGDVRWRRRARGPHALPSAVDGDRVYATDRELVVRDATTGETDWTFDPGVRESLTTGPLVLGGEVFVGTGVRFDARDYGTVFRLSGDGAPGYEFRADGGVRSVAGTVDADGLAGLYAAVDDAVHGIDPGTMTGSWSVGTGRARLAADADRCYAATADGLVALA
jgi:outer membrane protein assembly factor BamB